MRSSSSEGTWRSPLETPNLDLHPVVVGQGRFTLHRNGRPQGRDGLVSPLQLMTKAVALAAEDAGLRSLGLQSWNVVGMIGDARYARLRGSKPGWRVYGNPPACVAAQVGEEPDCVESLVYSSDGGNMPQALVNSVCDQISKGEIRSGVVVGCEALYSFVQATRKLKISVKEGEDELGWGEGEVGDQERLRQIKARCKTDDGRPTAFGAPLGSVIYTEKMRDHGIAVPSAIYPLFEQSLRASRGATVAEHNKQLGELFAPFSKVAARNPSDSWFGVQYKAGEISGGETDVGEGKGRSGSKNRFIGRPFYRKRMNAVMDVDMGAAVILMSYGEAKRRGIARDKIVFVTGCGDANDAKDVLRRRVLHGSPAMRVAAGAALRQAGIRNPSRDLAALDVYSCFPVAVEVAMREAGLDGEILKSRGVPLTVTGGLPYHGGPGNAYVVHSIAKMVETLRLKARRAREARPWPPQAPSSPPSSPSSGRSEDLDLFAEPALRGLVTANGGYLTKHSFGVYSTGPRRTVAAGAFKVWKREDPAVTQRKADEIAAPLREVAERPSGPATIEAYVVLCGRSGEARRGVVVGTMKGSGKRFVANTPRGKAAELAELVARDCIGEEAEVHTDKRGRSVISVLTGRKSAGARL